MVIQAEAKDTSTAASWVCRDLNFALNGKVGWGSSKGVVGFGLLRDHCDHMENGSKKGGNWNPKSTLQEKVGLASTTEMSSVCVCVFSVCPFWYGTLGPWSSEPR